MTSELIIKSISQAENTPELRTYWERRFKMMIEKGVFELHDKTIDLLNAGGAISKPFTPFGLLDIALLTSDNGEIDEVELQNTIDTAIRLLDNVLDTVNGNEQSLSVMKDYRKIAIGIKNYESYLLTHPVQTVGMDTLGNLLSNGVYRASESIAEEKGTCRSWDTIKKTLRPKTFEYWYHVDTGKIIDAHTLCSEYDQQSILKSGYEIIPRRNSHLLSYPYQKEWSIWTDRDIDYSQDKNDSQESNTGENEDTADQADEIDTTNPTDSLALNKIFESTGPTEKIPTDTKIPGENKNKKIAQTHVLDSQNNQIPTPTTLQHIDKEPNANIEKNQLLSKNVDSAALSHPLSKQDITASQSMLNLKQLFAERGSTSNTTDRTGSDILPQPPVIASTITTTDANERTDTSTKIQVNPAPTIDTQSDTENEVKQKELNSRADSTISSVIIDPPAIAHTLAQTNLNETIEGAPEGGHFQIGELVVITDKNSPFFHQTAQIVDMITVESTSLYTLKSNIDEINKYKWRDQQLSSVDLFDLLDRINVEGNSVSDELSKVIIQAFIYNEDNGNILIYNHGGIRGLPEVNLVNNAIPEQAFSHLFKAKYGINLRIIREIGSAVDFGTKNESYKVILAFQATPTDNQFPAEFEWVGFREAQFSLKPSTRVICNKFNRIHPHQNNNPNNQEIQNNAITQNNEQAQIYSKPQAAQQKFINHMLTPDKTEQTNDQTTNQSNYQQNSNSSAMNNYIFKLENLVKSDVFGDVTVNFVYENDKPVLSGVTADNLTEDLQFFAEVVVHFSNHLLSLEQNPGQIAEFLLTTSTESKKVTMNDLLQLLAQSLKNVPSHINPS